MCDDDYPDSYWDIDQWPDEMTRRVPRLSKQDEQRLAEQEVKPSINIKKPVLSLPRKSASK